MSAPPTVSVLGYALLGLLARGDQSGYDLAQGLKDPVSFFWFAQHSQIYPELARLEAARLVRHTVVAQSERPDKKVYSLTPAGQQALESWLEAPAEVPRMRDEVVLKAYSLWLTDPYNGLRLMHEHAEAHAHRLAEYERRLELLLKKDDIHRPDSPWFSVYSVLMRGIGYERSYLEWCRWMVERLEGAGKS
ncbi:MAG: PadR family transcriptional regulator [Meiothermus sp.]|nr:PadR family transcriptional regulator [Meiothermus sp.]